MKTLLFAPMILDTPQRLERNLKWLKYYTSLQNKPLEFDQIFFVDNNSPKTNIKKIKQLYPNVIINECDKRLERISVHAYGYWYRAFKRAISYAILYGYDKILCIDSDCYILTPKICDYLNQLNSDWTAFWCERWKFPESTFQVICKDQFPKALQFYAEDFLEFYPYDIAETKSPYTHIEKSFNGDRFGEIDLLQKPEMDYYCQANNGTEFRFNK